MINEYQSAVGLGLETTQLHLLRKAARKSSSEVCSERKWSVKSLDDGLAGADFARMVIWHKIIRHVPEVNAISCELVVAE